MSDIASAEKHHLKSLWAVYDEASQYEYADPDRAHEVFTQLLTEGLENYTASPDLWHNTSMSAARAKHREAEEAVVLRGQQEWPDNIDLMCDELQLRHTTHYDLIRAREIWGRLDGMDRKKTAPYWRFWVYGAIYHATILYDPVTALNLLNEGLRSVSRDSVTDILRNYRRVVVDSIPTEALEDEAKVVATQESTLNMLEGHLRLGMRLGVENGYVLATELARLYCERAGTAIDETDPTEEFKKREYYIKKALSYLDYAEVMYTRSGSSNYPIWEVYEQRISILMAQRKYEEALYLLRSQPRSRLRDPSLETMLKFATLMTGGKLEMDFNDALDALLLQDGGARLLGMAQRDPGTKMLLRYIVQRLADDEGGQP
jgi:hypothetical protein